MQHPDIDAVCHWLQHYGSDLYGGEQVTQLEHALQCAALAEEEGASATLITAALLHDIFHLAPDTDDRRQPHEQAGAQLLASLFPAEVIEPIRLHVDAKRYLCAVETDYWFGLSEMSKRSLEWQGGPFTRAEATSFAARPFARDAVRLRRWDDAAKVPGKPTPPLEHYLTLLRATSLVGVA